MPKVLTDFLFGIGRSMDVFGGSGRLVVRPRRRVGMEGYLEDARAIAGDWRRVGADIQSAMIADLHEHKGLAGRNKSSR